jgi:hypothetical protein
MGLVRFDKSRLLALRVVEQMAFFRAIHLRWKGVVRFNVHTLHTTRATMPAILDLGLMRASGEHGYELTITPAEARWLTLFFDLHTHGVEFEPAGLARAWHPVKGWHFARVKRFRALSNRMDLLPIRWFPFVNSLPLCATQTEEIVQWKWAEIEPEDRAIFDAAGFVLGDVPRELAGDEPLTSQDQGPDGRDWVWPVSCDSPLSDQAIQDAARLYAGALDLADDGYDW